MEILIVDDTVENIKLVSELLSDFDTSFARSGEEALALLEKESFNLILLDVMMPGLDGYETCEKLRKMPKCADTPVIFLTAKNDNESIIKGFESGGQDFISKPFNTEELRARIKNQLITKHYQDRLKEQFKLEQEKNQAENISALQKSSITQTKADFVELYKLWEASLANISNTPEHQSIMTTLSCFDVEMQKFKENF